MEQTTYLFIDGGYLQEIYSSAIKAVFGVAGELAVWNIVDHIRPFRTYYYDCLDDTRKDGETPVAFEQRLKSQESYSSAIGSLPGVHVRLGTVTGRRRRQKEIDVLLAVDMLTHGFNRNMTRAALLAGDLDFRPVVDALVRAGVFVEVWYEKKSASKDLCWAADQGRPINWKMLYDWSSEGFRASHQLPVDISNASSEFLMAYQVGCGSSQGQNVELLAVAAGGPFILFAASPGGNNRWLRHTDKQVLERYFSTLHGPIIWKVMRDGQG